MFDDDFLWETLKKNVFFDMLKFATHACISALGIKNKNKKTKGKQCLGRPNIFLGLIKTLWRNTLFAKISDWIV